MQLLTQDLWFSIDVFYSKLRLPNISLNFSVLSTETGL